MKFIRWCCAFVCVCFLIMPGYISAYDAVGVFLNFPQGDLDDVTRIDVYISPFPFGVDQLDSYPPAYKTDQHYFSTIFPGVDLQGFEDPQGALGSDWERLAYDSNDHVQSYEGNDTLQSQNASGEPTIVDGYVYDSVPTISGVELVGYVQSAQTELSFVDSVTVEYAMGPFSIPVDINLWRLVVEPDDTPPVIYLYDEAGDDLVEWPVNIPYEDLGVFAEDNVDGEIVYGNLVVTVDGTAGDPATEIDTGTEGNGYTITYTASDAMGNASDLRTRTVTIGPDRPPVIFLNGVAADDEVTVRKGQAYIDEGVTAIDDVYDISDQIETRIDGAIGDPATIDTSTSGVDYVITYDVSDYLDQAADTRQRIVHIVDSSSGSGGGGGGGCFIASIFY